MQNVLFEPKKRKFTKVNSSWDTVSTGQRNFDYLISMLYRQMPPNIQLNRIKEKNRTTSLEGKCAITRMKIDFDFVKDGQEIKASIWVESFLSRYFALIVHHFWNFVFLLKKIQQAKASFWP